LARVPLARGHAFTLIGFEPLPSDSGSKFWISALLDAPPAAELVIYADPARGTFRYASVVGRRLEACLFIAAKASALPSRDALAALLGTRLEPETRAFVLAGAPAGGALQTAAGKTICACFGVGLSTLHGAIAQRRLTSVAEIGAVLRAGTNCGSCIPELKAILNDVYVAAS
jgi:assimilatory nitrate reductase catalytic subunit